VTGDEFKDRVAALEEPIVARKPSVDEFLARAEQALADGDEREAHHCLTMAKIRSSLDWLEANLDEEEDDDA